MCRWLVLGVAFWRPYVQLISQSGFKSVESDLQREKSELVENWVDQFMIWNKKCDYPYLIQGKYK